MKEPGKLIVVGGHSRHVGKTSIVEAVLRATPGREWIAVKVSSHRHDHTRREGQCQQSRYLAAGARRALLVRAPDDSLPRAIGPLSRMRARGRNLLIESNRVVEHLEPDLVLFVIAPGISDWKPSSGPCLRRADAIVCIGDGPRPSGPAPVFSMPDAHAVPAEFTRWLLERIAGRGHS